MGRSTKPRSPTLPTIAASRPGPLLVEEAAAALSAHLGLDVRTKTLIRAARQGRLGNAAFFWSQRWWFRPTRLIEHFDHGGAQRRRQHVKATAQAAYRGNLTKANAAKKAKKKRTKEGAATDSPDAA